MLTSSRTLLLLAALQVAPWAPPVPRDDRPVRIDDVDQVKRPAHAFQWTFIDVQPLDDYMTGHIPPAHPLSVRDLEVAALSGPRPDAAAVIRCLGRAPATSTRPLLVYSGAGAGRQDAYVAWLLAYAGVPDLRILDGGFPSWVRRRRLGIAEGYPIPFGARTLTPDQLKPRLELRVDPSDLTAGIPPGSVLVEIVAADSDQPPGPRRIRAGELLDAEDRFLFPAQIRDLLKERGLPSDQRLLLRGERLEAALAWVALAGNGFRAAVVSAPLPGPPLTASP